MSYAIESKKRKFHRVLESISKPLNPTLDNTSKPSKRTAIATTIHDTQAPLNPSIKKVRINGQEDSDATLVRNSALKQSGSLHRTTSTSSSKRPTFVPWSREAFLERLETFRRVDRWTPKPSPINEVQWAKHGWICTDVMRVSCVSGCGGSVVVKLPDEIDELDGYDAEKVQERKEVRAKLVEEYMKRLYTEHQDNCPWRNKACDATIQHLSLANPENAIAGLRDRYVNLLELGDKLPADGAIRTPEGLDIDEYAKILPETWLKAPGEVSNDSNLQDTAIHNDNQDSEQPRADSSTNINPVALALAIFGWTVADTGAGLVGCKACFRRLGLWMYKPKENGDVTVYSTLDVVTEHMEYCPWIDRVAQSGTGKAHEKEKDLLAGWEVVLQAVKVKHRRRLRSTTSTDTLHSRLGTPLEDTLPDAPDDESKKTADREWWAKIRRMRQVLSSKSPRRKSVLPQ
ncbi:hypothetical protein N7468_006825 [Penicillium chermesinum]|uniref:Uncharacterized protein n=1 Tax=Penicillium chermesinum TaxID=63820 RepID=A0A9W9NSX0_9EURO|nr:uncharacterized protein N7468_006825 [Penicillium chermesinum]KAJ5225600.1 hypothetical protein N7468_006825 [Penicillium chermesinum]KAJ6161181.1 hypothetical protein N7470_004577 [Penicillium chermesinum]